jgi:NAD(P)-dependent dehydrogenase (short-subunit alcohol dehydrogenase family)
MVLLADVRTSNSALREGRPIVAVFAGATSGIGESTLKALAFNANQPRVYIIGRNEARAAALVKECHKLCPEGVFNFLKSDLSLLTNVDELCEKIKQREKGGRLDLLFMSQGYITLEGRKGWQFPNRHEISISRVTEMKENVRHNRRH